MRELYGAFGGAGYTILLFKTSKKLYLPHRPIAPTHIVFIAYRHHGYVLFGNEALSASGLVLFYESDQARHN